MSDPNLPGNDQGNQPQPPHQAAPVPPQPGSSAQPPQPMQPPQSVQPPQPVQPMQQPTIQQPTAPVPPQAPAQQAPPAGMPTPPAPPVPPQPGQPMPMQPAPQAPMNTLAIVSFIAAFFIGLVGVICGHISLSQIKKTGERGRGFALAGTIIGYVQMAIVILAIVFSFILAGIATSASVAALNELEKSASSQSLETTPGTTTEGTDPTTEGTDPTTEGTTPPAGGDRSPEFCSAIDALSQVSASGGSDELIAALNKAAALGGPSAKIYSDVAKFIKDPTSGSADTMNKFTEVLTEDMLACSGL